MSEKAHYKLIIRRFDPEGGAVPGFVAYEVSVAPTARLLDALLGIKGRVDGSLTFRCSCGHGVCGSCAMNINGVNALACQTLMKDLPPVVRIEPLPALKVLKDLIVDVGAFFSQNDWVMPYLENEEPSPERERLQSPEEHGVILESVTCIMCACCTTACPSYWADRAYLGPSALLKAYRFIFDSRDRSPVERLRRVDNKLGVWRCHSVLNCVEACPKRIDITRHIAALKRKAAGRLLGRS